MRTRILPAGLLCVALTLGTLVLGPAAQRPAAAEEPAEATFPLKILLGGDSITQGFDGDYTWRYRFWKELKRQKVNFDFVGPHKCPTGRPVGSLCTYLVPGSTWDTDHGAIGGTRLSTQQGELRAIMEYSVPDVLVTFLGTTDLLPRPPSAPIQEVTVDEEIDALEEYVETARDVRPDIKIVLGEVTARAIPASVRSSFNTKVNKLAADMTTPQSPVVIADLEFSGWNPAKHTYDGTHPTPDGEANIAQRLGHAFRALHLLPKPPEVPRNGLRWAVPWKPSLRVSKTRRLVVNWSQSYIRYAPKQVRVQMKRLKTGRQVTTGWIGAQRYVSGTLKPGLYKVRIQGRRNTMLSPWSTIWTFRVR